MIIVMIEYMVKIFNYFQEGQPKIRIYFGVLSLFYSSSDLILILC